MVAGLGFFLEGGRDRLTFLRRSLIELVEFVAFFVPRRGKGEVMMIPDDTR